MTILLFALSFFLTDSEFLVTVNSEFLGQWKYEVEAPDMTYSGIMELSESDEGLTGKLVSQGTEIPMDEVVIEGNDLSFKMVVMGYQCSVTGTFESDKLKGVVSVEGMELPLVAIRK